MVLGHEGVGVVEAVGPDVKVLKKGDRVGWGYEHDSCGHCDQCLSGRETYCPERKMYGLADFDQGSFASGAVWREAFLFKTPDGLSDEAAAPLQCGGATVFNALYSYDIKPTETVGVMGVGSLGECPSLINHQFRIANSPCFRPPCHPIRSQNGVRRGRPVRLR